MLGLTFPASRLVRLPQALAHVACFVGVLTCGCSGGGGDDAEVTPVFNTSPGTDLDVELISDILAPKDVDSMRSVIIWPAAPGRSDFKSELGTPSSRLPQSLGGLSGGFGPSSIDGGIERATIDVEVTVWKGATPFTVTHAIAPIPPTGNVALRLSISWLCAGTAKEAAPGQVVSTCPEGQSCRAGSCRGNDRSAETLPSVDASDANPPCFDVERCMAGAEVAVVDHVACTVTPAAGFLPSNVAVVKPPQTAGQCNASSCLVALNHDDIDGFSNEGAAIRLPPAVCAALDDGRAQDVLMSDTCPTKHASASICDTAGVP